MTYREDSDILKTYDYFEPIEKPFTYLPVAADYNWRKFDQALFEQTLPYRPQEFTDLAKGPN